MTIESRLRVVPGRVGLYAQNLDTGLVTSWHEHEVFASASLIKVPILAEVFRRVEEESLNLDETLIMRSEDQVPGSGILKDLTPNTRFNIRDLATLMITVSDNTATNLLIDFLDVRSVNALTRRLGLLNTVLERRLERIPMQRDQVNRTTAYDMTRLMGLIAQGELISADASRRMAAILLRCQAPQSLAPIAPEPPYVGQLPRIRVAHKTGSLDQAQHDSGIVYTPKTSFTVTILSEGAPHTILQTHVTRIGLEVFRHLSR